MKVVKINYRTISRYKYEVSSICINDKSLSISDAIEELDQCNDLIVFDNAKPQLRILYNYGIFPKNIYDVTTIRNTLRCSGVEYNECGGIIEECKLQCNLARENDLESAVKLDNNFIQVLAYIETCGIPFNKEEWENKIKVDRVELCLVESQIINILRQAKVDDLIDSQADMFEKRVCKLKFDVSSKKQVNEVVDRIGDKFSVEFKKLVNEYSYRIKLQRTFGEKILEYNDDGRIYGRFSFDGDMSIVPLRSVGEYEYLKLDLLPNDIQSNRCFSSDNESIEASYQSLDFSILCNLAGIHIDDIIDIDCHMTKNLFSNDKYLSYKELYKYRPYDVLFVKELLNVVIRGGSWIDLKHIFGMSESKSRVVYNLIKTHTFDAIKHIDKISESINDSYISNNVTKRKMSIDTSELSEASVGDDFWNGYKDVKETNTELFNDMYLPKAKKYLNAKSKCIKAIMNGLIGITASDILKTASVLIFKRLINDDLQNRILFTNINSCGIKLEAPNELKDIAIRIVNESMNTAVRSFLKSQVKIKIINEKKLQ